jgi:hypothetical protein
MANHKRTGRPGMLIATALVALTGTQCNKANCEDIRDELFRDKLEWASCTSDDQCIIIGGNERDCSGVLTCNLAINKSRRQEAERRIISLPEETADCIECASPNCPEGEITLCERVSKKCIIVKGIVDSGLTSVSYGAPPTHSGGSGSIEVEETAGAGGGPGSPFDLP